MATGNFLDTLILGSNTTTPNAATKVVTGPSFSAGTAVMSTNGLVTSALWAAGMCSTSQPCRRSLRTICSMSAYL